MNFRWQVHQWGPYVKTGQGSFYYITPDAAWLKLLPLANHDEALSQG